MEKLIENTEKTDITKKKIKENTYKKINLCIEKINTKATYLGYREIGGPLEHIFEFICPEHGMFSTDGYGVRVSKGVSPCPECLSHKNEEHLEAYPNMVREEILEVVPGYDYSTVEFGNIDNTVRPVCPEHGEFLTTPRKLINGDSCKWCDGIQMDTDGNTGYKLDRQSRLEERFDDKKLKYIHPYKIIEETPLVQKKLSDYLWSFDYASYLQDLRDHRKVNSIFFKLNITDKSTKFQFSIIHAIYLNDTWFKWYLDYLETTDTETAQRVAGDLVIEEWFHYLFYGKVKNELKKKEINFDYEISHSEWSIKKRITQKLSQYKRYNIKKAISLPEAIATKILYPLEEYNIGVWWSENRWDTTSGTVALVREVLGKSNDECPICNKPIKDPVLDHEHKKKIKGSGRIRDNICLNCNVFIAKTENNCKRYNIEISQLPGVLKNVSDYFSKQQYNIIHYTDKDKRPTITKTEVSRILKHWELLYPKKKKPKTPKTSTLTKEWEQYRNDLNAYLANPFPKLNKNDYNKLLKILVQENEKILAKIQNEKIPKSRRPKLIEIPDFPKLKVVTPYIKELMDLYLA